MKFCIVSPPTVNDFDRELAESEAILRLAEHAPVGVLTLVAVLDELGNTPEIVDMNVLYYEYLRSDTCDQSEVDFCAYAVAHFLTREFDVIGFGTICSSYPLTLRIAEGIARANPQAWILLGGPQASVVDIATLERFPFVDCVVRFEAEETLPALLQVLDTNKDLATVNGITYRRKDDVVRTPSAPVISDLDSLPLPAYQYYPYIKKASYVPLELGRGCPYACSFCSTNDFFRRNFRLKSPRLIVEQMTQLKADYEISVFDLIHDMFTVNRKKVVEFCNVLLESEEKFHWNCSARTDRVDDELLTLMSEAGCRGIFFGIETGSQALQETVNKRLVLPDAMTMIRTASERGLQTAVSLITGFPDETEEDFGDTVDFFLNALRYENAVPQLHILAPLADTPLHRRFKERLTFDDIISDMSHQGWEQPPEDRDLIAAHPDVFPNFYGLPTPLDRPFLKEVRSFLLYGMRLFRWLLVALHQENGHILNVFREFEVWRAGRPLDGDFDSTKVSYFQTKYFREQFAEFVRSGYLDDSPSGFAFAAILDFSVCYDEVTVDDPTTDVEDGEEIKDGKIYRPAFNPNSVPALVDAVKLLDVDIDYESLQESLIEGKALHEVPRIHKTLASRKFPGRWPEVLQLSPMSLAVLELCDGVRTVQEIAEEMTKLPVDLDDIPVDKATLIGLEILRHDGLISDLSV